MICSLPIVMLCLPLGGVSLYEVFAAYLGMIATVGLFGMISLWASGYFRRRAVALVVSCLMICRSRRFVCWCGTRWSSLTARLLRQSRSFRSRA